MSTKAQPAVYFCCSVCGESFLSGRSNEEALAESRALWGEVEPTGLQIACDECFHSRTIPEWEQATGMRAKLY
jgi:hypothetical protein